MTLGYKENLKFNLELLMKKHGITNEVLAEKTGISRSSINRIRMNKGNPTVETLLSICDFFKITVQELTENTAISSKQPTFDDAIITNHNIESSLPTHIKWDELQTILTSPFKTPSAPIYTTITPKEYINIPKNSVLLLNKNINPNHGDYVLVFDKQTNIINVAEYIQDISGNYIKSCISQSANQLDQQLIPIDNYSILGVIVECRKVFKSV